MLRDTLDYFAELWVFKQQMVAQAMPLRQEMADQPEAQQGDLLPAATAYIQRLKQELAHAQALANNAQETIRAMQNRAA